MAEPKFKLLLRMTVPCNGVILSVTIAAFYRTKQLMREDWKKATRLITQFRLDHVEAWDVENEEKLG